MRRFSDFALDVLTAVVGVGAMWLIGANLWDRIVEPHSTSRPVDPAQWEELITSGRWVGPPDAKAVLVAFMDYQCPACRYVHPVIEEVQKRFPDSFAVVYWHWPLPYHDLAYVAARAAECAAEQGRFEPYHRLLLEDHSWEVDPATFPSIADQAGVEDMDRFTACSQDPAPVPSVEAGITIARSIGARGTPTLFINRRPIEDRPTAETLTALLRTIVEP